MGSVICDHSQKGNVKFTSKMERLPRLREDDKVVWNWWCIVWVICHCHGNKTYQFFRSRSTCCFIFQTISLKKTSVPWLEHQKKIDPCQEKNDFFWTGCICRDYVFPIHGQYQIHLWSPQDSPERFLQLIWRWRVTLERNLPFRYAWYFMYIFIDLNIHWNTSVSRNCLFRTVSYYKFFCFPGW